MFALRPTALLAAALLPLAGQVRAEEPRRDPREVPLPAAAETLLRLGSNAPLSTYGAIFDRIAPDGALPVVGPGATLQIRAAADRARVFLAWTQYDLDGDGAVTRPEFDQHADMSWGESLGAREVTLLNDEWQAADANADGVVTHSEILGLALVLAPVPDPAPLGEEGEAMLQMDLDNDGFVVWDEVEAVLMSRKP